MTCFSSHYYFPSGVSILSFQSLQLPLTYLTCVILPQLPPPHMHLESVCVYVCVFWCCNSLPISCCLKHLVLCPPFLQLCGSIPIFACCYKQMRKAVFNFWMTHFGMYQGWCCKHWRGCHFCSTNENTTFWWLYVCDPSKKCDGCLKYIILAFSSQQSHAYCVWQALAVKTPSTLHLFYNPLKQRKTRTSIFTELFVQDPTFP